MLEIVEKTETFSARCADCGQLLTNPGYSRNSVYCCGKYRRWYHTYTVTYEHETGRDALGRFAGKPSWRQISRETTIPGGI